MELGEAFDKANQILDEERSFPTVDYLPAEAANKGDHLAVQFLTSVAGALAQTQLQRYREERPRQVLENRRLYRFRSSNYNLLHALLSRLKDSARPALVQHVLSRIHTPPACASAQTTHHSAWCGLTSELPLVIEFAARNGGKEGLMRLLGEVDPILAHVLLLRQLEEMISLDFALFTSEEYTRLSWTVQFLTQSAQRKLKGHPPQPAVFKPLSQIFAGPAASAMQEIVVIGGAIQQQCRKARYLYVKGELEEGLNLEVNQDKDTVESYLRGCGFSDALVAALNEAERLYQGAATAFELKACMGHIRSFLENLHKEVMP
ncbi:MAG: hypothetical protein LAN59_16575, partial [Acidobacteriia bacterium]|nr:hypothetical protein [Terriglobia bacterium]